MKTAPHVARHAEKVFYHSALIEIKCMSKRQLVGATLCGANPHTNSLQAEQLEVQLSTFVRSLNQSVAQFFLRPRCCSESGIWPASDTGGW